MEFYIMLSNWTWWKQALVKAYFVQILQDRQRLFPLIPWKQSPAFAEDNNVLK